MLIDLLIDEDFNPHSRKGSDNKVRPVLEDIGAFQSTLPQGE